MRQRRDFHIRIHDELDDWLTAEARRRMVSKNRLIEYALEEFRISLERAEGQGRIVALADLYDEARS